ncbi:hypothetical protein ACIOJE_07715 [Kitasatospora sp. NPDC087861]|uniref:hypothetical protein n=1 Tax=Kitasatospora sp. NPDC087861 TaxID=3364070 RepID=UPI0037FFDB9F
MITVSNLSDPRRLPRKDSRTRRVASLDVEWTKNYRIKNGNRAFCFSLAVLDVPTTGSVADLVQLPFAYVSMYVEDAGETGELVAAAADTITRVFADADLITGHQLCSDLAVLVANRDNDESVLDSARAAWSTRRNPKDEGPRIIDTRYDAGHLLDGTSRRLVDVCTELGLDVTQPELRSTSMTNLHRRWLEKDDIEARERVSVLNLRHSLSTALVAVSAAGLGRWDNRGLNVNRMIAAHADGWGWLQSRTFQDLLGEPCPFETARL